LCLTVDNNTVWSGGCRSVEDASISQDGELVPWAGGREGEALAVAKSVGVVVAADLGTSAELVTGSLLGNSDGVAVVGVLGALGTVALADDNVGGWDSEDGGEEEGESEESLKGKHLDFWVGREGDEAGRASNECW
jgi:hypothetical protein